MPTLVSATRCMCTVMVRNLLLDFNAELDITSDLIRFLSFNEDKNNAFLLLKFFVVASVACVFGVNHK